MLFRSEEAKSLVGFRHVIVDRQAGTVFLDRKGMQIDLGGIIKGYAADRAVAVLRQHGVANGIVAVAGDIRLFGRQPDGRPWHVGIQHPRPQGDEAALLAELHQLLLHRVVIFDGIGLEQDVACVHLRHERRSRGAAAFDELEDVQAAGRADRLGDLALQHLLRRRRQGGRGRGPEMWFSKPT